MEEKQTIVKAKMMGEYKEYKYLSNHNDSKLLKKYIHDIKNSKTFSIDILKTINNLSYEDRMEILIVYNEMISYYLSLFEYN
jgi:hypothetical protein